MKKILLILLLASCQTVDTTEAIKKAEKINDEQINIYWQTEEALQKKDTILSRSLDIESMNLDDEMEKVYYILPDSIKVRLITKFKMETEIRERLEKSERLH